MTNRANRRAFMKWTAAFPMLAAFAVEDLFAKVRKTTGIAAKDDIYSRIGVTPIINGRGTWTFLTGSLELPEVREAKQKAALHFVDLFELQRGVGKRLAELSGAESGMVTAGAAAAMATATAACIAGTDPAKIWQLPDTTGLKSEVIMFGGRIAFDSAIRAAGGKLAVARTHDDLKRAFNDQSAMVYTTASGDSLQKAIQLSKDAHVPILVDWAAGIPPFENLSLPWKMGADLYTFSGGKGLGGPQCSGLLLGRKDLIEAGLAQSCPWEGAVCRPMKVGKEEIMGLLAAVEAWQKIDLNALDKEWNSRAKKIATLVETVPGVTTDIQIPRGGNRYPTLTVTWDVNAFKLSVQDCAGKLRDGTPRIEVLTSSNPSMVAAVHEGDPKMPHQNREDKLQIVSMTLQPGEDAIVGRRLREILNEARKNAA